MKAMTVLALAVMMTLGACNTVDGIGRDISDTANTVGGWF
jgi:predicted small secreted protein